MRFFFDNNLSVDLVRGMRAFGEKVDHLQDHFPEDAPDVEWLEYIGTNEFFLVTRDHNIRKNPAEKAALREFGVGVFFLGGKSRNRCELIQQLVRNWPRIKEHSSKTRKPFAFRIPPTGTKFEPIPLG
ncbi:MAG: DUF5615 family PIN-like protein [Deferrisomatales bacterium]|nr:DUF5615 family PIN-like protein [Deferrisomatales bacterium]